MAFNMREEKGTEGLNNIPSVPFTFFALYVSFGSIKDLFSAITEKRLELLRYVAERQGTLNTRQLAQALGRDYKNVHTDVSALDELGLIEKGEKGVLTVPYDEIVIHAGLTEAA